MMKYESLPAFVRESTVLNEEEKLLLTRINTIPTDIEIDLIRHLPEIQELTNAFIGDENTRDTHLQLKAKEYLVQGNIVMAWKVILL